MLTQERATTQQPDSARDLGLDPGAHLLALMHGMAADGEPFEATPGPRYRRFLDALGVAVYTADAAGRITYYNDAAAQLWGRRPEYGEEWCGSWRLFWSDGRPMRHVECPMAITLREQRPVRGYEAFAERPDGTRVCFQPFPSPLYDEKGRMIGAVNVMVDVTERKRAEDALRATADALAASSAVKDEFLGLVSHELRTPVTTIFGNAQLLRERGGRLPDGIKQQMVSDIAAESERLLGIVENLLMLTRLGAGSPAEHEPQVVTRVVRDVVEGFKARHPDRRVTLRAAAEETIVEADRAYLEALLVNLLSNAAKYSVAGAPIEVSVRVRDGQAEVRVCDRGIGIRTEDAQVLFTPFFRGDSARHMANGVGIGLTVCRRLAEALGGRVWARARRNGGSEFGFALPLAPDQG